MADDCIKNWCFGGKGVGNVKNIYIKNFLIIKNSLYGVLFIYYDCYY